MCVLVCVCRCEIKIIDFGSSCYVTDHLTSYVQSRSHICTHTYFYLIYTYHIFNIHIYMYIIYVMLRHGSLDVLCSRNNHTVLSCFSSHAWAYTYISFLYIYTSAYYIYVTHLICIYLIYVHLICTFNMHIFDIRKQILILDIHIFNVSIFDMYT